MQEENIVDADFEEIDDNVQDVEASNESSKMSRSDVLHALKDAVESGHIKRERAQQIREEMGIFKRDFTKKTVSNDKRKAKRKAQRKARKQSRRR